MLRDMYDTAEIRLRLSMATSALMFRRTYYVFVTVTVACATETAV
jgi:hypothetical protein